jgi:phytoene dehydrogenase-like protein
MALSIAKREDGRWRARYRDAAGKEHARHFARKVDAQRWLDDVTSSVVTGTYTDPRTSNVTLEDWSAIWLKGQVHLKATGRTRVEGIVEADERAVGVTLTGGEEMQGDAVVVATDAPTAAALTSLEMPTDGMPVTCAYFASTEKLYDGATLLLNANPDAFVNHAVQISNVAATYAPKGQHLLSATVLGAPEMNDAALTARCREDLASWFPGKDLTKLRQVGIYRIKFAQFRQPPGVFATLPPNATPTAGLFLAGEYTESSSIDGAMSSGAKAAQAVLRALQKDAKESAAAER